MSMLLRTLLAKDLRRARRNPLPWVILLIVPVTIVTIVGLIFGPRTNPGGLGQIHFAFVDEDDTWLTNAIVQSMNPQRSEFDTKIEQLPRAEALRLVNANKLAAAVIVAKGFTDDYLNQQPVRIELVKNPANVIHPTFVEEYLAILSTGLNAVSRVAGAEFATWRRDFEEAGEFDLLGAALVLADSATRLNAARDYLRPPLVGYKVETPAPAEEEASAPANGPRESGSARTFRFLLIGMGAMFLLMIADTATRDFYRELSGRTLARYRTLRDDLMGFVAAKAVFAVVMVLLGAVVMFGGGGLMFQFGWRREPELIALTSSYALFAAGLVSLIAAIAGTESRAAMFNNIIVMGLAILGGCMFPLENVKVWREHIAPWMPTHWFASTAREMQYDNGASVGWIDDAAKLAVLGGVLLVIAAWRFRRRLEQGGRP